MPEIIIAVGLAALRIAGHKSPAFQATAHLFIGWLVGMGWPNRSTEEGKFRLGLVVALSIVEVACAIWLHFAPAG